MTAIALRLLELALTSVVDEKGEKHWKPRTWTGAAFVAFLFAGALALFAVGGYYGSRDGAKEGAEKVYAEKYAPELAELKADIREIRTWAFGQSVRGRARAAQPTPDGDLALLGGYEAYAAEPVE